MSAFGSQRQAYAFCAYCPKVCRFACPVSESTHNETTSTWGKMSQAFLVTQQMRRLDAAGAKALYACTGCMRCTSFCKHENEVGFALFAARSEAVDAGLTPEGVTSTLKTFAEHGNPFGKELSARVTEFRPETPVRYQLFPGCSSLAKRPELIEDCLAVGEALSAHLGVCRASGRCCGYPLYAAGDLEAFQAHARQFVEAIGDYPELVVLDPGCAYTMKVVFPRVGVELPNQVRTIYEVLAEHLDHAPSQPPLALRVGYHDACHLGRGLGQYEAPRRLLRAAVAELIEAPANREQAGCSGGGGLLPRAMHETAIDIARRQASEVGPEGETVVTACPTSRRMFERAGRPAEDLLSVLRRWLSPSS